MEARIKQAPTKEFRLGLEKQGLQYFEITESTYEMPFVKGKWQHGLTDSEKKLVEEHYGKEFDNPKDFDFWAYELPSFTLDHTVQGIDLKNPEDILKIGVLKAMKILASDIEETEHSMAGYGFYISNTEDEEGHKASLYERRDQAIADLLDIKKSAKYIIAFAKFLLPPAIHIGDANVAYTKIREFLDGKLKTTTSKTKGGAIDSFNYTKEIEKTVLYATIDYREAVKRNIIRLNENQRYYNVATGTVLGKNEEECIKFLLDPKNQDELGMGTKSDKSYSIRNQLKN